MAESSVPSSQEPRGSVSSDTIATWNAAMSSSGRVEVGLSPPRVLKTFTAITVIALGSIVLISGFAGAVGIGIGVIVLLMFAFFALVPHLQFATGGKPAVLVDSAGIEIARWGRLVIPWAEIESVEVLQSTHKQYNTIVRVSPSFYGRDLADRSALYRLIETPARAFVSYAYSIPSTTAASPHTLGVWLAEETKRRRGEA